MIATREGVSYSRPMRTFKDIPHLSLIVGAAHLPPATTNKVTLSVIDILKSLQATT